MSEPDALSQSHVIHISTVAVTAISEAAKVMREDDGDDDDGEEGEESDRQAAAADALTVCAVKDVEGGITADESAAGNVVLHVEPKAKMSNILTNLPRFRCCC